MLTHLQLLLFMTAGPSQDKPSCAMSCQHTVTDTDFGTTFDLLDRVSVQEKNTCPFYGLVLKLARFVRFLRFVRFV